MVQPDNNETFKTRDILFDEWIELVRCNMLLHPDGVEARFGVFQGSILDVIDYTPEKHAESLSKAIDGLSKVGWVKDLKKWFGFSLEMKVK